MKARYAGSVAQRRALSKEERAAAEFARKLVLLSGCALLVPEIAVSVEFPRFLTSGARTPRDE